MKVSFNGSLNVVQFFVQQGFDGINELDIDGDTGLAMLIYQRYDLSGDELFMPCIILLIETGAELDESYVFEELTSAIQNRIIEITFMKEIIFEKWTGRIAKSPIFLGGGRGNRPHKVSWALSCSFRFFFSS